MGQLNVVLGLLLAIAIAWLTIRLGVWLRLRFHFALSRPWAILVGVVIALGLWLVLRLFTQIPTELIDALGIGPAVGLSEGLRRPVKPKNESGK